MKKRGLGREGTGSHHHLRPCLSAAPSAPLTASILCPQSSPILSISPLLPIPPTYLQNKVKLDTSVNLKLLLFLPVAHPGGGQGKGRALGEGDRLPLKALSGEAWRGGHTIPHSRGWAPHHLKCKGRPRATWPPSTNILHHHFLNRDKDWSRYPLPVTPTIGGTWATVQMGMGVHGREESTGPEPAPFKEGGGGPPGQGGK